MAHSLVQPLRDAVVAAGFDAAAIVPGPNFLRLFGRDFHLMERPLVIIVPAKGDPVAIVPNLEMASFSKIGFDGEVFDWRDEAGYRAAFQAAAAALPQLKKATSFALEAQRMRVFEQLALAEVFPEASFTDGHQLISTIRLHKTANEVARLRKAIDISERALEATLSDVRVGQTEKEIEGILIRHMFAHGADGLSFSPIVAAADNSAQPHARARGDYNVKPGDALLIDFGATWQGLNADITRTCFIGEVSDYDRDFYHAVLAANEAGHKASLNGATAHDVDDAVQKSLEASPFAAFARHKTGHGLGLDVHEAPQIMRGNHQILQTGMIYTIEPGLYRLGECGVRIEDDVVITDGGSESLTHFPKELRLLG